MYFVFRFSPVFASLLCALTVFGSVEARNLLTVLVYMLLMTSSDILLSTYFFFDLGESGFSGLFNCSNRPNVLSIILFIFMLCSKAMG